MVQPPTVQSFFPQPACIYSFPLLLITVPQEQTGPAAAVALAGAADESLLEGGVLMGRRRQCGRRMKKLIDINRDISISI